MPVFATGSPPEPGYRLLFEKAPEALLAVDRQNLRLLRASDAALRLLACERNQLQRYSLGDLLGSGETERIRDTAPGLSQEIKGCQLRDVGGNVSQRDLRVAAASEADVILISIQDGSVRAQMEDQLRQAQKMEALGMLSGGIAHDFNNLLTIISGYSQMLIASPQMTAERDVTAVEQILKASERAADLTRQLLAFSRRQTAQPKVLEINRIVDQTATMLTRLIGEDVELRIERGPDAGRIHADAGQIQQVLMNLAINSRDAMPQGGVLRIRTQNAQLGNDYVVTHIGAKPGSYVMVEVSDTGTGIDEATRARVFEPFFTTKPAGKGTGLGLSTVYGLVRQCGGSIDLSSQVGRGTTFRIYLPRVQDEATAELEAPAEPRGGHETILLVEDEEGVRRMVHVALERRGYKVLVAGSGIEGLRTAREHAGHIDLLISDMIMPQMNGREFAAQLLKERPGTRVLYISGYAGEALESAGALANEAPFLQKPFAPVVLTTKVREILDNGGLVGHAGHHS